MDLKKSGAQGQMIERYTETWKWAIMTDRESLQYVVLEVENSRR